MGSTGGRKARFWRRSYGDVEEVSFGGGTGTEAQRARDASGAQSAATSGGPRVQLVRRSTVAEGPDGERVEVVEVIPAMGPEAVRINSNADILCINLEKFDIDEALEWIKERQALAVERYGAPANITVMAKASSLTKDERRRISWEIEPAGAKFRPWADNCDSFGEAFEDFAASIRETYQWPMVLA